MKRKWIASIVLPLAATSVAAADRIPVEVWRGGDDGLTIRFSESLEKEFGASSAFALAGSRTQDDLVARIPTHLAWKMIGARLQFDYDVEFKMSSSKRLGNSKGTCWEDEMPICARSVVEDATRFTVR